MCRPYQNSDVVSSLLFSFLLSPPLSFFPYTFVCGNMQHKLLQYKPAAYVLGGRVGVSEAQ